MIPSTVAEPAQAGSPQVCLQPAWFLFKRGCQLAPNCFAPLCHLVRRDGLRPGVGPGRQQQLQGLRSSIDPQSRKAKFVHVPFGF